MRSRSVARGKKEVVSGVTLKDEDDQCTVTLIIVMIIAINIKSCCWFGNSHILKAWHFNSHKYFCVVGRYLISTFFFYSSMQVLFYIVRVNFSPVFMILEVKVCYIRNNRVIEGFTSFVEGADEITKSATIFATPVLLSAVLALGCCVNIELENRIIKVFPSVCLSIYLFGWLVGWLVGWLFVSLSVCLSVCLSVFFSLFLFVSQYVSLYLSFC